MRIKLLILVMELAVGRAVLDLPEKDLRKVNKMILRNRKKCQSTTRR
jgi:hypothetical protein